MRPPKPIAALAVALALSSAPSRAGQSRFWTSLDGVPIGTVGLSEERGAAGVRYRYESVHLFGRGAPVEARRRTFEATLAPDGGVHGRQPVSRWLWHRPAGIGCVEAFDELGGTAGVACAEELDGEVVRGTALGERYLARYDGEGLVSLELGRTRFTRAEGQPRSPGIQLLLDGVEVSGRAGALAWSPALGPARPELSRSKLTLAELRELARRIGEGPRADWCLGAATAFVEEAGQGSAAVVYGVVADGGRAYPHAWVRVLPREGEALELDPALGRPVSPDTHLAISAGAPPGAAGAVYLELSSGRRRVIRRE